MNQTDNAQAVRIFERNIKTAMPFATIQHRKYNTAVTVSGITAHASLQGIHSDPVQFAAVIVESFMILGLV